MKKSIIEAAYEAYLREQGTYFVRELKVYTDEDIEGYRGGLRKNFYRYDFYIPDTHTLIELDDDNHYRGGRYEEVHKNDLIKDELAEKLNLNLIRIDVRNEAKYLFCLKMQDYMENKTGSNPNVETREEHNAERLAKCHSWFIDYVKKIDL